MNLEEVYDKIDWMYMWDVLKKFSKLGERFL